MPNSVATPISPTALPVNKAAQLANSIIKGIEAALAPEIQAAIIAAVPALGIPIVKQLVDEIESLIEDKITVYLETGADFIIIDAETGTEDINVSAQQDALDRALASGDPAAIAAAKKALTDAEDSLTTDDGSSAPV